MRSRCRKIVSDCSISLASLTVGVSLVGAITVLNTQPVFAESVNESKAPTATGTVFLAQSTQSDDAGDEKSGTASGGAGTKSNGGMSDRLRKYMGEDGPPPGGQGRPPGPLRPGQGPDDVGGGGGRERMRQMLQQMPPEKRDQILQEMKERRMRKRGLSDGANGGGTDNRFMNGPEGGPDGGPGFGGRGNGISEYGFKRGGSRRNFGGPGDKGMKGGKLFGREPLDLTVLNLTADQKAKIQSMRTVDGQKSRQIQAELRQRRDKFKDMLFDPAATSEQIISTHKEINKLQSQTQDIMLNDFLGIRKLLTKEQLELLPQVRPDESRRPSPRLGAKIPPDGEPPMPPADDK